MNTRSVVTAAVAVLGTAVPAWASSPIAAPASQGVEFPVVQCRREATDPAGLRNLYAGSGPASRALLKQAVATIPIVPWRRAGSPD